MMLWPNQSPEPTSVPSSRSFDAKADGAGSWRSQRCHDMDASNMKIAERTVIAVAVPAAGRRWLSFFR